MPPPTLMIFLRECGHSYREIGLRYGISRQRVGMILKLRRPDLCGRSRPN